MNMSTVEIETGQCVKRFEFWNPATWSVPKLYWDAWSQEQRLHAICRQLEKVIAYADYLGVNVDDIASRLKAIEEGQLDDLIVAAIERWFEEHEADILLRITELENALPISEFDENDTVKSAIDAVSDAVSNVQTQIGNGFDENRTVEDALTVDEDFENDFDTTQETYINQSLLQYDFQNKEFKAVANPQLCIQAGQSSTINPLPLLWYANTYRTASDIRYGNEYTAINVNDSYSAWEPAYNHPRGDGYYNIDCNTLVVLALMGIPYSGSTYSPGHPYNIGRSYFINMFTDATRKYIDFPAVLDELEETEPEYRRLLTYSLAKALHDAGQLVRIHQSSSVSGLKSQISVGDILFFSNAAPAGRWESIGHCAIVAFEYGDEIITIDASSGRGGINTCVNYHVLTEQEISQVKWKTAPPEMRIAEDYANPAFYVNQVPSGSSSSVTYTQGGSFIAFNNSGSSADFTITYTFPSPVGEITETKTLPNNAFITRIVPPGVQAKVESTDEFSIKHYSGVESIVNSPYIPAS